MCHKHFDGLKGQISKIYILNVAIRSRINFLYKNFWNNFLIIKKNLIYFTIFDFFKKILFDI